MADIPKHELHDKYVAVYRKQVLKRLGSMSDFLATAYADLLVTTATLGGGGTVDRSIVERGMRLLAVNPHLRLVIEQKRFLTGVACLQALLAEVSRRQKANADAYREDQSRIEAVKVPGYVSNEQMYGKGINSGGLRATAGAGAGKAATFDPTEFAKRVELLTEDQLVKLTPADDALIDRVCRTYTGVAPAAGVAGRRSVGGAATAPAKPTATATKEKKAKKAKKVKKESKKRKRET